MLPLERGSPRWCQSEVLMETHVILWWIYIMILKRRIPINLYKSIMVREDQ